MRLLAIIILPLGALAAVSAAADFTVHDNRGAVALLDELELRGRIAVTTAQTPHTYLELAPLLPDTGRYAHYRRQLDIEYPRNGYRFMAATDLAGTVSNHGVRPAAGSVSRLGMRGAAGDWSFCAVDVGQTGDRIAESAGYRWRGVAASSDQVYISWSGRHGAVQFGKDYLGTGMGLALSGEGPCERIQARYDLTGHFRLTWSTAQLDSYSDSTGTYQRYLASHRLEYRSTRVCIGANEYMLYGGIGRPVAWYYLLPFYVYQGEQLNRPVNDNAIWDIDAKVVVPPLRIRIEAMIDDLQIERQSASDREPSEIGLAGEVSVALADAPALISQHLRYMMVTGWTYNQRYPWNRWLSDGASIGAPYGNDFDHLALTTTALGTRYRGQLELSLLRKGEGRITDPWTEPWVSDPAWVSRFPSGIVERRWTAALTGQRDLALRYGPIELLCALRLSLEYASVENAGHRRDLIKHGFSAEAGLAVSCSF